MVNNMTYICPFCFRKGMGEKGICQNCGFNQKEEKQNSLRLPSYTRLNNRYLLGCLLGAGGFGITYKAWDAVENRVCAIKEFVPLGVAARSAGSLALRPVSREREEEYERGKRRFVEEAQTLMKCHDIPQVVKIQECFVQNNTVYYAMEYLDGTNLRKYVNVRGRRLPLEEAWSLIYQAGIGLEELHRRFQIFHRDVSPENIMITQNGNVKLIDFGSAKYLVSVGNSELSIMIKPGFTPPEQYLKKGSQGCHTDVYALAGTFYTIVSGSQIPDSVARMAGGGYRSLKDLGLGISAGVSDAVDAALELDYQKRTPTVAEFLGQVERGLTEPSTELFTGDEHWNNDQGGNLALNTTPGIQPYLLLNTVDGGTRKYVLPSEKKIGVGRDASRCMIQISDGRVSGFHLELWYGVREGRFYICDHSLNGTFYRGQRLQKETTYQILPGEELTLSRQVCRLRLEIERTAQS